MNPKQEKDAKRMLRQLRTMLSIKILSLVFYAHSGTVLIVVGIYN